MLPKRIETLVDRLIKEAREEGKFDNLKNHGKPIKIEEENPYIDEDWRVAYKIVENAGAVPPWVELDKEIEQDLSRVERDRLEHRRWLKRRLDEIKNGPTQYFARDLRRLKTHHESFLKNHANRLNELNQKIETFNFICPVPTLLKIKPVVEQVIRDFDYECPAIPII